MRRFWIVLVLVTMTVTTSRGQEALTRDQRISDLTELASQYAKNYGPYEWKRDALGFDLLRLTPWLQRIHHSDDLDFQEALIEYVASLNDAHDLIAFPTTFSASLPISVDIYDGTVLIDFVFHPAPPAPPLPFAIGDEIVMFDGRPVRELIESFGKYAIAANPRSTERAAAARLVSRSQQIMPHIHELGPNAVLVLRRAATGALETVTFPWSKFGIPVTSQGPLPSPVRGNGRITLSTDGQGFDVAATPGSSGLAPAIFQVGDSGPIDDTLPAFMQPVRALLNASVSKEYYAVRNIGGRFPIFAPPAGFTLRPVPPNTPAFLLSGTYTAPDGKRIGFLRIPSMNPPSVGAVLAHLDLEIAFFNANTDALVIDVMRNPGGLVSFVEAVSQRFMRGPFRTIGFEIRATAAWLFSFASQLSNARLALPPGHPTLVNLENNFNEVLRAYNANRGRTAPISLNASGSLTLSPATVTYTKPLMVLTDEFSASGGDMFPALIQDNNRGLIVGMRTMGAGGSVITLFGPAFTESIFRMTVSLMNRGRLIQTPEFPAAPYVENIGVRPDIVVDYMTRANLMTNGAPFVAAVTQAIMNHAR